MATEIGCYGQKAAALSEERFCLCHGPVHPEGCIARFEFQAVSMADPSDLATFAPRRESETRRSGPGVRPRATCDIDLRTGAFE